MSLLLATSGSQYNRTLLWSAVIIGAVCGCIGFANPVAQVPLACLLFPAGLVVAAFVADGWRRALKAGFASGVIFFVLSLYWLVVPLHWYGGMPFVLALPAPLLMALYLALYPAVFCLFVYLVKRRLSWPFLGLFCGCLFALLEALRGVLLSGFPWMSLPSAFAIWPSALQLLPFTGPDALTALLVICATWVVVGILKRRLAATLAGLLLFAAMVFYGFMALDSPIEGGREVSVGFVQGNIDQGQKWDEAYMDLTVSKYSALTEKLLADSPSSLVVWPETALPFSFQDYSARSAAVRALARRERTALLVGAPGYERSDHLSAKTLYFNRAFLIEPSGKTVGVYEKEHLVPFGEYMPLGLNLPFLENLMAGAGNFTPGRQTNSLKYGDFVLGMLICYEAIFPALAQERVADGANLLVNISNDAWFGRTPAARQHLHLSMMRAIEQGRFMIRSTNTGISAIIDPQGRLFDVTALFEDSVAARKVQLLSGITFYHRIRPWVIPGLLVLTVLLAALAKISRPEISSYGRVSL